MGHKRYHAEGTGLGLTITQNLVEAMDGSIVVDSHYGQGSCFTIDLTFPVLWDVARVEHAVDWIVGYHGHKRKILIVDDSSNNRALFVDLLAPLGFELREAVNGRVAIEQAEFMKPDLIFMDLKMPDMDGFEAVRQIRAKALNNGRNTDQIKIVAASVNVFESDIQQSLAAGCDDFLAKPIEMDKLFTLLENHLKLEWIYREPARKENDAELETAVTSIVYIPAQEIDV